MTESLNVIALISGGKDSFFSLLHCLHNGHKVVALGNLYPTVPSPGTAGEAEDEHDLNSFMYQTVGHTVIPLYEKALGIPLYRQQIIGSAVQTASSYGHTDAAASDSALHVSGLQTGLDQDQDETESLVPLLWKIMRDHPEANAISSGAILSTYQRTRLESVALRLGLVPLAFLWQYPILAPETQTSLLEAMQSCGLDARIVKVASGGLDESFLWDNVADARVMRRIERAVTRFGTTGDGAVLGEGGEFETLVVDGPGVLFKGRIEVMEEKRKIVREGGGSAWLRILEASVVMKATEELEIQVVKPEVLGLSLLEPRFCKLYERLLTEDGEVPPVNEHSVPQAQVPPSISNQTIQSSTIHRTFTAYRTGSTDDISGSTKQAIDDIRTFLHQQSIQPSDIISTVIVLRSMDTFNQINSIYNTLFTTPNPPARVTISSGSLLPETVNMLLHLRIQIPTPSSLASKKALHVQSRSYWAPANIGPYSQAISISPPASSSSSDAGKNESQISLVYIAGQIPLIPSSMTLPSSSHLIEMSSSTHTPISGPEKRKEEEMFKLQATLSLQHLFRIAYTMQVRWFSHIIAFLPSTSSTPSHALASEKKAILLGKIWRYAHQNPSISLENEKENRDEDESEEEVQDLWAQKYHGNFEIEHAEEEKSVPGWDILVDGGEEGEGRPPIWTVVVDALPRGSGVEWAGGMGIVGEGRVVKISTHQITTPHTYTLHTLSFNTHTQIILSIPYSTLSQSPSSSPCLSSSHIKHILSSLPPYLYLETLTFTPPHASTPSRTPDIATNLTNTATYIDTSIPSLYTLREWGGVVPCSRIYDRRGERYGTVIIWERL